MPLECPWRISSGYSNTRTMFSSPVAHEIAVKSSSSFRLSHSRCEIYVNRRPSNLRVHLIHSAMIPSHPAKKAVNRRDFWQLIQITVTILGAAKIQVAIWQANGTCVPLLRF